MFVINEKLEKRIENTIEKIGKIEFLRIEELTEDLKIEEINLNKELDYLFVVRIRFDAIYNNYTFEDYKNSLAD